MIVLLGLHLARTIVGPLAIAIVIVIVCLPVGHAVTRRIGRRWAGTGAIVALAYAVILAAGALIWLAGAQFTHLIADLGPGGDLLHVTSSFTAWSEALFHPDLAGDARDEVAPFLREVMQSVTATLVSTAAALFFVCAYVVVMAVDAARYARASAVFGSSRSSALSRIRGLNQRIRRYYVVNSAFGALVAAIDGLALWTLGVPAPVVWAVLAFVTNFVPSIGFVIGLVPPALLALALGGWPLFLSVVAVYCVVNVVLQVFLQPKFVSDAVGLSLTLTFFAVVFWTFILGPVGAILAIPLTLLGRSALFEGRAGTTWWRWLSGDDGALRQTSSPRRVMPWKRRGYPGRHHA